MSSIRYKENKPSGEIDPRMDVGRPIVSCTTVCLLLFRCATHNMADPVHAAQRRAAVSALFVLGREKRQAAAAAAAAPAAAAGGDAAAAAAAANGGDGGDAGGGVFDEETDDGGAVADATGDGKAPAPPAAAPAAKGASLCGVPIKVQSGLWFGVDDANDDGTIQNDNEFGKFANMPSYCGASLR